MNNIDPLIQNIKKLTRKRKTLLIGIDGRGGAGKTTLALKIKEYFPEVKIVTTDDFYNDGLEKIDENLLYQQFLKPLSEDKVATYKQFLGRENRIVDRTLEPGGIVIVEGVYALHSYLADIYDYKIWVDSPLDTVSKRVLKRDKKKEDEKWQKYHRPNEDNYINNDKPIERADFIVRN